MTLAKTRNGMIAALDIGTTKICCFIAERKDDGTLNVTGIGHQRSKGLRAGAIVNMDAAEQAILAAITSAETMTGETIREVIVNLSGGAPGSKLVDVEVPLSRDAIGDNDIDRAIAEGFPNDLPEERALLHTIPTGYRIDGSNGIDDPRGMFGHRLGVKINLITAMESAVRNLSVCIERCHLDVHAMVESAFAAGLASLVDDEMQLGATLIDIGGGTTSIAVFMEGTVCYTNSIPIGGQHVTNDIARGLSTPISHAERMKTLYGSALTSQTDDRELIDVPSVGEDERARANHVPRSMLTGIIKPRMEEIFELVRNRLEASGFDHLAGRRVVLTGGASQLQGTRELAADILGKQVRLGRPIRLRGLAEATGGPAFATCAGLLGYALRDTPDPSGKILFSQSRPSGRTGRIGQWLRENF
ncbi:cell division protein FtsA [Rhodospirillaceae bacterium AH-315-P19]|nr:cell division protein FtsA [Rhodospirillaceae bacterium AH-315-P19]